MANAGRREESKGGKGGYIPTSVLWNRKICSVYINKIGWKWGMEDLKGEGGLFILTKMYNGK